MICVISPAKKMSVQFGLNLDLSMPMFGNDAQELLDVARKSLLRTFKG